MSNASLSLSLSLLFIEHRTDLLAVIEGARNRLNILRKKMAAAQQAQAQQQTAMTTQQKRASITSISGSVPKASPLSQTGGSFPAA